MVDFEDPQAEALRAKNWKKIVLSALAGQEDYVASQLATGAKLPEQMEASLLKINRFSVTVRLKLGDARAVLKVFDATGQRYHREKQTLIALRGSTVAPNMIAFCDERRFILTDFVPGLDHEAAVETLGWPAVARAIGVWLGRMDHAAPAQPATGNWAKYLANYEDQLWITGVPQAAETLAEVPLCGQVLAQCDSALSNIIFQPNHRVIGVDFEQARFRPRGWDFAMYFISFAERCPYRAEELLQEMAAGFASVHRGVLIAQELCTVARSILLLRMNSFAVPEEMSDGG